MLFKRFNSATEISLVNILNNEYINIYLTNTIPSATAETVADLTLITLSNFKRNSDNLNPNFYLYKSFNFSTTNEYQALTGDYVDIKPLVVKAYGGSVGPFRYIVFALGIISDYTNYSNNKLIAYFDYGFSRSLASGQTMTLSFPSNIMYTIE